jgi:hypothetical protein
MSISGQISAEVSGIVPFIWEKIAARGKEKLNRKGLVAAYTFELYTNLEILKVVKFDALNTVSIGDPVFRNIVNNLHTEVAASILFSQDRRNYGRFLKALRRRIQEADRFRADAENDGSDTGETVGSVLEALSFSVRKIEALKSLAAIVQSGSPLFPDFRLAVRLGNINRSLLLLRHCVAGMNQAPAL